MTVLLLPPKRYANPMRGAKSFLEEVRKCRRYPYLGSKNNGRGSNLGGELRVDVGKRGLIGNDHRAVFGLAVDDAGIVLIPIDGVI